MLIWCPWRLTQLCHVKTMSKMTRYFIKKIKKVVKIVTLITCRFFVSWREVTPHYKPQSGTDIERYVGDIQHLTYCIFIQYRRKCCRSEGLIFWYRTRNDIDTLSIPISDINNLYFKYVSVHVCVRVRVSSAPMSMHMDCHRFGYQKFEIIKNFIPLSDKMSNSAPFSPILRISI